MELEGTPCQSSLGLTAQKFSTVSSTSSTNSDLHFTTKTKDYMNSLQPPSPKQFERIALVQQQREQETKRRDRERRRWSREAQRQRNRAASMSTVSQEDQAQAQAARTIQKTFRGYRTRREMQGFGLDASTRWVTAIREAQFRHATLPRPKTEADSEAFDKSKADDFAKHKSASAREKWKKASAVARRAGHDDLLSDSESSESSSDEDASPEERAAARARREKATAARKHEARMMGIRYFLEMVDQKHRYGSNLCRYHEVWKRTDTTENFFYWLDYGEGRNVEVDGCPRDRLEREQVRYLSREERQYYLVEVDSEGRLCWAKNGQRIDTTEEFKDSIYGVVPVNDSTPAFNAAAQPEDARSLESVSSSSSDSSLESRREADRAAKYATPDFDNSQGMNKVSQISASTIFNKLMRKSVRKNTWIFVADTSFRMYVGIKDSGAFQHSSFLQGSRISSAGLIKIKNGRLSSLSPLSGHYRPPAANFRAFVASLRQSEVDMSHVSISKSYVVLIGLETYIKTKRKGKDFAQRVGHRKDKIIAPEEAARREEEAKDKSESAAKEREVLQREEAEKQEGRPVKKVLKKLGIKPTKEEKQAAKREKKEDVEKMHYRPVALAPKPRSKKTINIDDAIFRLSWRTERNTSLKPCQAFGRLPMASVTRSSRRAEAPHQHHPHHHLTPPAGVFAHAQGGGGGGRNKRVLDTHDRDFDAIKPKRTRLTVEIFAKGTHGLRDADIDNNKAAPPTRKPAATPTVATTTPIPPPPTTDSATSKPKQEHALTKHQSKVINGIKHELDRLQPQPGDINTQEQGRKLRSQEATRFKSELSAYFPEYDEVIGNEPKEQQLFNVDTPIVIVDSDPRRAIPQTHHPTIEYPVRGYGDALFYNVFDCQQVDLGFLESQSKNKTIEDPLPDKLFQPIHRRAERLERSIRNTEKGRAQHERDQIIRLLEGLQGHDWLRVMGVSGVTETKKKTFEPARNHFIKGCQAILDKFRNWVLEEKRRKMEKDKARAEKEEENSSSVEEDEAGDDSENGDASDSESPAKQLQEEAMARSKNAKGSKNRKSTPQPAVAKIPRPAKTAPAPKPPEPPKEFKSFFSKRYERDSALHRHRRAGRKIMAWGLPMPEIPEVDFDLPEEYRGEDTLKARARQQRRERRRSKQ
ncbi:hypothetical protein FPRO03_05756 [Fusarium proliferatum]|nr:hypothetical protein FPRO03_05756 [Fusarium proliferatum]